ncbi:MAG TPA: MotA/TolQ/ExbB proton channel family protein [Atribacteraceae bacterium]|nr:MotA/TolQ/ExbB proton channel family protein [Atribacteraceae bacterium]
MQIFAVLARGGYIMYPIVGCSVVFLAVFLERWYVLRFSKEKTKKYLRAVRRAIYQGDLQTVHDISQKNPSPASRVILAGLKRYINGTPREARDAMEIVALQEFPFYEKRLGVLVTIASVAPLLGLLGTVTGMIRAFDVIAAVGVGRPMEMAGGISEALITTAAGLSVAIPSVIAHYYLSSISESIVNDIEKTSTELMEAIEEASGLAETAGARTRFMNNEREETEEHVPVSANSSETKG